MSSAVMGVNPRTLFAFCRTSSAVCVAVDGGGPRDAPAAARVGGGASTCLGGRLWRKEEVGLAGTEVWEIFFCIEIICCCSSIILDLVSA